MRKVVVYVADAGSVAGGNFGWARGDATARERVSQEDTEIEAMVDAMVEDIRSGIGVALGFECPLFFPVPADAAALGKARAGECSKETGNKPFTGSAGACSAVTGVVELAWILRRIHGENPTCIGTLDWTAFAVGHANLFLWEAFISGKEKGPTHTSDAALGVRAFLANLDSPMAATQVTAESPFSLAGAVLLWSGLTSEIQSLHRSVPVLRPLPTTTPTESTPARKPTG